MSKLNTKNILLAITNGYWFIDIQSAEQLGHNVAAVLAGKDFWTDKHKAEAEFTIIADSGPYISKTLNGAKAGSIAVINIDGPIMKYDNCGDPGSQSLEQLVKSADANPNIIGLILKISSGGGEVSGTQSLSNVVKAFSKPKIAVAEDLMGSAAYWIGCNCDYIFANTETTMIGSIGGMWTFKDMRPLWKAQGIIVHEIYADQSSEKNADFKAALDNNYEPLKKNLLNPLTEVFINNVKSNRSGKLDEKKTLNGQMYTANDALKYGLIDEIGGLDAAINKINQLASGDISVQANSSLPQTSQTQDKMKKVTLMVASMSAIIAMAGVTPKADETSVEVELTDDLLASINSAITDGAQSRTDLDTATSALVTATETVTANATEIASLKADNKILAAKVSTLSNAGATITKKEGDDEIPEGESENDYTTESDVKLAEYKKRNGLV